MRSSEKPLLGWMNSWRPSARGLAIFELNSIVEALIIRIAYILREMHKRKKSDAKNLHRRRHHEDLASVERFFKPGHSTELGKKYKQFCEGQFENKLKQLITEKNEELKRLRMTSIVSLRLETESNLALDEDDVD